MKTLRSKLKSSRTYLTVPTSKRHTFRSGLEARIGGELESLGEDYSYEELKIEYVKPAKKARYTPDFQLKNGIIIEAKGRFVTEDRQKHLLIRDQHPELDIRFVFSNPNQRIGKKSKTTYAMWCEKHGFLYAKELIPLDWIKENPNGRT